VTAHYVAKVYRGGASIYRESLMPSAAGGSIWQLRTVADLIRPAAAVVEETTTVSDMLRNLPGRPVRAVYVVNGDGERTGFSVVETGTDQYKADLTDNGGQLAGYVSPPAPPVSPKAA